MYAVPTKSSLIHITDRTGRITRLALAYQPRHGSIVMTQGEHGTAWQRFFDDGDWHSVSGEIKDWDEMLRMRNLVLVYDAPIRNERRS